MDKKILSVMDKVIVLFGQMLPPVQSQADGFTKVDDHPAVRDLKNRRRRTADELHPTRAGYRDRAKSLTKLFVGGVNHHGQKYGLALSHKKQWGQVVSLMHDLAEVTP